MTEGNGNENFRIGIVSGKLGDVDGVSLEVDKWVTVLHRLGHTIFTIAGRYATALSNVEPERQLVCEEIQFGSPEQIYYEKLVFPHLHKHPPHISEEKKSDIMESLEIEGGQVASQLFELIQNNAIDVVVGQNTNAMPMTLLGGVAMYRLATSQRIATILHHHDFWWERSRFSNNHIEPLLSKIMPPVDPGIEHIVISTYAAHILSSLKRVQPLVIPNCEDFDDPVTLDDFNSDFREEFGFGEDDILIIQPTRIVRRKRIEDSVELVGRLINLHRELAGRIRFIISLYQGDEPDEDYIHHIQDRARELGVDMHLISNRVAARRGVDAEGRKLYTNRDVLVNADLVTYLPLWEGFGNAFLEAVAARVPVVISTYLVYKTDIKIMGFENIEVLDRYDEDGHLIFTDDVVELMYAAVTDMKLRKRMVERNFAIGKRYFGLERLNEMLSRVIDDYGDEIRASRRRIKKSKTLYSV